jgi:alpha-galactosidase
LSYTQSDAERELAASTEIRGQTPTTERERVMSLGFTEEEAECWMLAASVAGRFFSLPDLHQMDDHEVAHAIHVVQSKLLSRPIYRRYLELAREGTSAGSGPTGGAL